MEWFQNWINQIVLAAILCIIIELLLPENKSKKYVKTVIGIYMLFSILSPIASFIEQKQWEDFSLDELWNTENTTVQASSSLGENGISNIYQKELEKSVLQDLEEMGYTASLVQIELQDDGYFLKEITVEGIEKTKPVIEGMPIVEGEKNIIKEKLTQDYGIEAEKITLQEKER